MLMLELIIYLGIISLELSITIFFAFMVQGIVYWTTGFSIYNWLNKKLKI